MANSRDSMTNKNSLSYKEKVNLLKERISSLISYRHTIRSIPEPTSVKKARALVAKWEKENEAHKNAIEKQRWKARNAATEFLILGNFEEAIRVIREQEQSEADNGRIGEA